MQSIGIIVENLEKLPALIEFVIKYPEISEKPIANDDTLAQKVTGTCLDFARCYDGAIYLYDDDVQQMDWRMDRSEPLVCKQQCYFVKVLIA